MPWCRLLARDHAAPDPTLALSKAVQPCCGRVRPLAWCSRPRSSAALLGGALMDVLAVIHGESVRAGVFGDVVAERGHRLEEWSLAWDTPLPRPLDAYGAVLVFGGAMHADQDQHHPWLRDENFFLERILDLRRPVLGICLGAQLLAKAAH